MGRFRSAIRSLVSKHSQPSEASGTRNDQRRRKLEPIDLEQLEQYQYRPLDQDSGEIRLLKILPGKFDDELQLEIFHTPLVEPERAPDTRLPLDELQDTLPKSWKVYETLEGRYIFRDLIEKITQWAHPDANFDTQLYDCAAVLDPYPGFEPAYEALSYAWGSGEATEDVQVLAQSYTNVSSVLHLRPNLHSALKHLRYTDMSRTLWVDALCIDQTNLEERSREVKRMDKIFTLARRVVVWLGHATLNGSSKRALEVLEFLGSKLERSQDATLMKAPIATNSFTTHPERSKHSFKTNLPLLSHLPLGLPTSTTNILAQPACSGTRAIFPDDLTISRGKTPDLLNTDAPLPCTDADYLAIRDLLERSWWDRLWVWQEIHLANCRTIIHCGAHSVPWYFVRRALYLLRYRVDRNELEFGKTLPKSLINKRRSLADTVNQNNILDILHKTRKAQYSKENDRIFALFGLMQSNFVNLITADYSIPSTELFKNVCLAMLQYNEYLDFLEDCDITDRESNPQCPSWVPNWFKRHHLKPFRWAGASGQSGCGSARCSGGSKLLVFGVLCGKVQHVANPAPMEGDLRVTFRLWETVGKAYRTQSSCEKWKEEFTRIIRCGEIKERFLSDLGFPSITQCLAKYAENHEPPVASETVRGRSFFATANGQLGVGPPSARTGDVVAVLLGCDSPILLRPNTDANQGDIEYQVVGPAYVEHLMDAEALLGPLDPSHEMRFDFDAAGSDLPCFEDLKSGEMTYDDPHLWTLPEDWECGKDFKPGTREKRWFRNRRTGEKTYNDPRLTTQELRKRGVVVQEICLV